MRCLNDAHVPFADHVDDARVSHAHYAACSRVWWVTDAFTQTGDARWGVFAQGILQNGGPTPKKGKSDTTDHDPIHPLKYAANGELDADEQKIYEIVVRALESAVWWHLRVALVVVPLRVMRVCVCVGVGPCACVAWAARYPYIRPSALHPTLQQDRRNVT